MNTNLYENILDLETEEYGTIREFLRDTFLVLWRDPEDFYGKYGMTGDSDWPWEIYVPLAKGGFIESEYDPDHDDYYLSVANILAADDLIKKTIKYLFNQRGVVDE